MIDEFLGLRKVAEQAAVRGVKMPLDAGTVLTLLDRVEKAEQALQRVREVIECDKHWNDECGWDVPLIALTRALEGDE